MSTEAVSQCLFAPTKVSLIFPELANQNRLKNTFDLKSVFFSHKSNSDSSFLVESVALPSFALKSCIAFKLPKHPMGI